jgi:uncharacterized membrane protein
MNDFARTLIFGAWIFGTIWLVCVVPREQEAFVWLGSVLLAILVRVINRKVDAAQAKRK